MTEPDELYTLRAQFWLGHYSLAIEEAKATARRPMSSSLKTEREEFLARSYLASGQYDKIIDTHTPGLQALTYKAQYESSVGNPDAQETAINNLKSLLMTNPSPAAQLIAGQVFVASGQIKDAMGCVHSGANIEQIALKLHLFLKMDRLDLANEQLSLMRKMDEDAILTQLGSVYVNLATGLTGSSDAIHTLTALSEQYGPSPYLLNLISTAYMLQGDYNTANEKLQEIIRDHAGQIDKSAHADTLCNLIVCCVHQHTNPEQYVNQMKSDYPYHHFCIGLDRVTGAFDRESIKYKTQA